MSAILDTTLDQRRAVDARNNRTSEDLTRGWFAVEQTLAPQITALAYETSEARAQGRLVNVSTVAQSDRYMATMSQMRSEIARYDAEWAISRIDDLQRDLAGVGLSQADTLLAMTGLDASAFATFNPLAVASILEQAREGLPLMALLDRGYGLAAQSIADHLIAGVALGINPRQLAKDMVRNGLSQSLNHTLLVARDQGIRAWRTASQERYAMTGIKQYRRTAARQARTCIACLALDGTIYDAAQLFPTHPQCRCVMVPIVPGIKPIEIAPASEWLKGQSPAVQKATLGPERYAMYQKDVPLVAMVKFTDDPTWGRGTKIKPLRKG